MRVRSLYAAVAVGLFIVIWPSIAHPESWERFTSSDGLGGNDVTVVYVDKLDVPSVGFSNTHGISRYEEGRFVHYVDGRSPYAVTDMSQGFAEGPLWTAMLLGCGIHQFGNVDTGFRNYCEMTFSVHAQPDGTVWIAGFDGLIRYLSGSWTYFWGSPYWDYNYAPWELLVASDGKIWLMTGFRQRRYLITLDEEGNIIRQIETSKLLGRLAEDSLGRVWIAGSSLWVYDNGDFKRELLPGLSPGEPANLREIDIRDDRITVCGDSGVFVRDMGVWAHYDLPEDWPETYARSVSIDSNGDLWLGLQNAGVAVLRLDEGASRPIFVGIEVNGCEYTLGQAMRVSIDLASDGSHTSTVDLYIALEMASGELLFYPSFGTEMTPFLSGAEIPADTHVEDHELFSLTLPGQPAGTYRWLAACTDAGTMQFASNIASCEWQFTE